MSSLIENLNLEHKTENTLTTAKILMSALVKIRKERVGTDNEEFVDRIVSVAVPNFRQTKSFFCYFVNSRAKYQNVPDVNNKSYPPYAILISGLDLDY